MSAVTGGETAPQITSPNTATFNPGINGNFALSATGNPVPGYTLTDGLRLLRAMFGLTGPAVTNNAVGDSFARETWDAIRTYLNAHCGTTFAP